jgi:hypothetical protein
MTTGGVSAEQVRRILRLRILVATLGERTSPPWWRTQFLKEVGLRAMGRVFPRTAVAAALKSVTIAARAEHDKRIGVGGRYHLFRLPTALEQSLAAVMSEDEFRSQTGAVIAKEQEGLMRELAVMANGRRISPAEGPVRLGSVPRLDEKAGVEELAAHYRSSFETNRRTFPYFEDEGSRA